MRHELIFTVSTLFLVAGLVQQAPARDMMPYQEAPDSTVSEDSPRTSFMVDENDWLDYADQAVHEQYFVQARDAVAKGDLKEATDQLKNSLLFMRLEGGRATEQAKPALKSSEKELGGLIDNLKSGHAPSNATLDAAYTRANYALALHHYLKAKENWEARATTTVGHDLKDAANEWQFAVNWSGQQLSAQSQMTAQDVTNVGQKLVDLGDYTVAEVDSAIATIGKQVSAFGQTLSMNPKR